MIWFLRGGLLAIGILILFSFSRRRGPVRDLPAPVRATPVEFLEALGSLYAEATPLRPPSTSPTSVFGAEWATCAV